MVDGSKSSSSQAKGFLGIEWTPARIAQVVFVIGFLAFSLFAFAAFVTPLWDWFVRHLNSRFAMFCGFVGCFIVLVGVPLKLAMLLEEKKDVIMIGGIHSWLVVPMVWNLLLLVLLQLISTGGLPGLLRMRGGWMPARVFGGDSFVTRIFTETLGFRGDHDWSKGVVVSKDILDEYINLCKDSTVDSVTDYLARNPELITTGDQGVFCHATMGAIASGRPEILGAVAKRVDLGQLNGDGLTALQYLVSKPTLKDGLLIKALVEAGASPDAEGEGGRTAIHSAAEERGAELLLDYLLSKKANLNAQDDEGQTPLHLAALAGNGEQVALLIVRGADTSLKNDAGEDPLTAAESALAELAAEGKRPSLGQESAVSYLKNAEAIKAFQQVSEWKSFMSSKGTMWFFNQSSWKRNSRGISVKVRLMRDSEVLSEGEAMFVPEGDGYKLSNPKPVELKSLTSGASSILNSFLKSLPDVNLPRVEPRWTGDKDYDWNKALAP